VERKKASGQPRIYSLTQCLHILDLLWHAAESPKFPKIAKSPPRTIQQQVAKRRPPAHALELRMARNAAPKIRHNYFCVRPMPTLSISVMMNVSATQDQLAINKTTHREDRKHWGRKKANAEDVARFVETIDARFSLTDPQQQCPT
jgi:hypothetical protein